MVHTVEIGHSMSRDKLEDFARSQSVFDDEQLEQFLAGQINELSAAEYQLPGFNQFSLYRRGSEQYCFLSIVVNLQVLLINRPTVSLFSCSQEALETLTVLFRDGLRVITDTTFQPLLEWSVVHVDYAIDIHTPNVGVYVALAKRAKLPRDYIERIDREGSFYPECDSVTLNFYDKLDQMQKKRSWGRQYEALCREATNIYRLEVQCRKSKRFEIMKRYNLPDVSLRGFLDERISQEIIQYYYQTTIGYGDYYSLSAVYQRIQDTCWRRPKKMRIYNWLRLIAQVDSYPDSIDRFLNGTYLDGEPEIWVQGSKRTLADYVQCCKNERINMITIPVEYGIDWLPNPMPEELR